MKFNAIILSLLMLFSTSTIAAFERMTMEQVKAAQIIIMIQAMNNVTILFSGKLKQVSLAIKI